LGPGALEGDGFDRGDGHEVLACLAGGEAEHAGAIEVAETGNGGDVKGGCTFDANLLDGEVGRTQGSVGPSSDDQERNECED
jgi:hypothetical protein